MRLPEIFLIAVGLSMDAFAVSIAGGASLKKYEIKNALKMGLFFGGFQAAMPVIGWLAGRGMKTIITGWDHWLAFGLLALAGGNMIYEAVKMKKEEERAGRGSTFDTTVILGLAVATSLDALAIGVTFSLLNMSIILPVAVIGLMTFILSAAGVNIGVKTGRLFGNKMEIFGGLIIIAIGLKILLEHLFFS